MISNRYKIIKSELSSRLKTLMLLRVLFISILLGVLIVIQIKETSACFGHIQTFHYLLIIIIYFLTFLYAIIFRYSKNLLWLAYLQLFIDTLLVTAIIFVTGGIESIFSFLYILTIFNASIILYRKGGLAIASSSSILYGLLLVLHYYNIIKPIGSRGEYAAGYLNSHLFYIVLMNIAGFYLVAYLSSYLSEQARKSKAELKAAQKDFYKLEVLNESIINSITSGLIALDSHDRIILFNPAAEEIFGCKAGRVSGQHVRIAIPFVNNYLFSNQLSSRETTKKLPPFIDSPFIRSDGRKTHLRLFFSPLLSPKGDLRGKILIFQDMTEIREIEEEMKKVEGLAMIGELAAGIAHEIRNPMASISGSIQMLRSCLEKDDVNSRLMDIISREINRLNHMINDFLLFARPKKSVSLKFDLNRLILETLELFRNSQHWTEKLRVVTNFDCPIELESDPDQVKQVLLNLFLNACEAMSDEGLLSVETGLASDNSNVNQKMAKIVVRDTGEGFDKKTLSQIFTPFFTTKEGGSGLGLAIVKRIISELQGEVSGSNSPEGGAELTLLLPVRSPDSALIPIRQYA
ncbi:MAG: hypothetical protein B1H11_07160 [Desulfobacteraceae bacterium 4484_190.1]|nr:MAG: hypothetical protein B1H11_07160 [Desulfobacteraceae bacterium 4484_190.1]